MKYLSSFESLFLLSSILSFHIRIPLLHRFHDAPHSSFPATQRASGAFVWRNREPGWRFGGCDVPFGLLEVNAKGNHVSDVALQERSHDHLEL